MQNYYPKNAQIVAYPTNAYVPIEVAGTQLLVACAQAEVCVAHIE